MVLARWGRVLLNLESADQGQVLPQRGDLPVRVLSCSTCERHRIPLGPGTLLIQLSVVNKSESLSTLWLARFFAGTLEQGPVKFRTKHTTRMA